MRAFFAVSFVFVAFFFLQSSCRFCCVDGIFQLLLLRGTFEHLPNVAIDSMVQRLRFTVEVRKLEHDRPPTPNQATKQKQHESSHIHVPR